MIDAKLFEEMINAPLRKFRGRVEVFEGSTLTSVCGCHDELISFTVERAGENDKFFGYGICQKLTAKFRDKERKLSISKNNSLEVEFGIDNEYIYPCPIFFVEDITRDENTNELTVVAYDALYKAASRKVSELGLPTSYTIKEFATACAALLGLPIEGVDNESFNTFYATGANFDGTETIRAALDAIAEATQTIYYIDSNWRLTFKRLDVAGEPVTTIDKSKYMTLTNKDSFTLTNIAHVTELGDNVSTGTEGPIQYIRNNPFWELRSDIASLVESALAATAGLTISNFNCSWRGNFLLEIGDKINFITKNDETMTSYLLNDSFTFNGGLSAKTQCAFVVNQSETFSNPTTLGEALKQTYAKVDKANQKIELVVNEVEANRESISSLVANTEGIFATVQEVKSSTDEAVGSIRDDMEVLSSKVSASMTPEEVKIEIEKELANGTSKVVTNTGFTFDDTGLTIDKSGSEMKTQITEDGMTVYKNNEAMLVANNVGVNAVNLHATTYLIVGTNSRFENYGSDRTGCFWIGG